MYYPFLYIDEKLLTKYGGHDDQLSQKYWGMDRFRIKILEKILASNSLSENDRKATEEMLKIKMQIFAHGAQKRGKNVG